MAPRALIFLLFIFSAVKYVEGASPSSNACTGDISSLDDVSAAVKCTTVNIHSFTVPAGKTFNLALVSGATVNMVNGNGHTFNGNGPFYWVHNLVQLMIISMSIYLPQDGLGGNGGVTKPAPMMKIKISGTFTNVKVLNSPARVYSISNPEPLLMSNLTIDDSLGDQPNAASNGKAAGHNTDGFDVSTQNLVIQDSVIMNQDDCLAINKGSNITFQRNTCSGGHGISVGSISSGATVSDVSISDNFIVNNDQALRIKTKATATDASVSGVTYSGNTAMGMRQFGVLIDQSYPDTLGTPGDGCIVSDINFLGTLNKIAVNSDAQQVAVNCGEGSCTGSWDWSALEVSGGTPGEIVNFNGIQGFSQ
ncbi:hypothetical protein NLI96_g10622 [Meripilus lineatus]|uniref:endo-polygalacturonase n=1 Tax=Meripilus lineatus TaxID=2056292 RepID=A0AAD5YE22_9APHY|nr:hypothetical protein NLI96_g10622 [Physisporinus lineatus]